MKNMQSNFFNIKIWEKPRLLFTTTLIYLFYHSIFPVKRQWTFMEVNCKADMNLAHEGNV